MIDYNRLIKNALARMETPDTDTRLRVYQSAMQAFENKFPKDDAVNFNERRNHLARTIQMIEAEHTAGPVSVAPVPAAIPNEMPKQQIPPSPPPSSIPPKTNPLLRLIRTINPWLVTAIALAIIIGTSIYSIQTEPIKPQTFSSSSTRPVITSSLSDVETTNLFDADFANGDGFLSLTPNGEEANLVRDGILKATSKDNQYESEYVGFYSSNLIEIDPAKIYSATAYVRYNKDSATTIRPNIYIGIATFAKDQTDQDAQSGDHRYFVINGQPPARATPDDDGWIKLSGAITGIGNHTHMTFRPGSAYARPVVLVSTKPENSSVELKSFTFGEIK